MDFSLQQSITNTVTFAVVIAVAAIQVKHKGNIFSLREMIEKSLLLRESSFANLPPDPNATPKVHLGANIFLKTSTER